MGVVLWVCLAGAWLIALAAAAVATTEFDADGRIRPARLSAAVLIAILIAGLGVIWAYPSPAH